MAATDIVCSSSLDLELILSLFTSIAVRDLYLERMWGVVLQICEYILAGMTQKAVVTTFGILAVIGSITERRERSLAKRKLPSLKKVQMRSVVRRRSPTKIVSPRSHPPAVTEDARRRRRRSSPLDDALTAKDAIEYTTAVLESCDLTGASMHDLYDFICQLHTTTQLDAAVLSIITQKLNGSWTYDDWALFLRERSAAQKSNSLKSGRSKSSRTPSTGGRDANTHRNHAATVSPGNDGRVDFDRAVETTTKQHGGNESVSLTASTIDASHDSSIDSSAHGGVNPQDLGMCKCLKAKLGSEDNSGVCTADHPSGNTIQGWRLVSRNQLPLARLFRDPEKIFDEIPENLFTTFNALSVLIKAVSVNRPTDQQVLVALTGFSSILGLTHKERHELRRRNLSFTEYVDTEYMISCLDPSEWSTPHTDYWTKHAVWKNEALAGIGITLLDDESYMTAGEVFSREMGRTMELPGHVKKRRTK